MIDVKNTLVYYTHAEKGCYFGIHTPKKKAGEHQIPLLQNVKEAFERERAYQEYNNMECNVAVDFTNFIFINRFGNLQHQGTLVIYTTVTKKLKQREFGKFEEKMKQQKQEWMRNDDAEKEGK